MAKPAQSIKQQLLAARRRSPLLVRPGFLIRRLHQIHGALFVEETRQFGVTPVQYSLLTALAARGEIDQNGIALEIGLERTSVAEVIPRLIKRGLIGRRQCVVDRRVKLVKLTRQGISLVRRMSGAVARAHRRTIEQLDPGDREMFLIHLVRLVEATAEIGSAPLRLR
jgi:DNA-binding MarR family transcriptional regulator